MQEKVTATNDSVYLDILRTKSEPILYEDDDWFVLIAKSPVNDGHILLIPKIHESEFFNLPTTVLDRGFRIATKLSKLLSEVYHSPHVAMFAKGFTTTDHAHIHLTPIYATTDMNVDPSNPRSQLSLDEMRLVADKLTEKVRDALSQV